MCVMLFLRHKRHLIRITIRSIFNRYFQNDCHFTEVIERYINGEHRFIVIAINSQHIEMAGYHQYY